MKELLEQYSAYNLWANNIICQVIGQLNEENCNKEIVSSFPSIRKTIIHMTETESAWWQRLHLADQVVIQPSDLSSKIALLNTRLIEGSTLWAKWVKEANAVKLAHVFEYRNSKKELFRQPVFEVIIHLCNHQTYHRGQLITMFRQLGLTVLPSTDFITFLRK